VWIRRGVGRAPASTRLSPCHSSICTEPLSEGVELRMGWDGRNAQAQPATASARNERFTQRFRTSLLNGLHDLHATSLSLLDVPAVCRSTGTTERGQPERKRPELVPHVFKYYVGCAGSRA